MSSARFEVEAVENLTQLRCKKLRQHSSFRRLDFSRSEALIFGHAVKPVEQNSLSDASQAQHHHSFGGARVEDAIHVDVCLFEELVASCKFRRLQSGPWRIRVFSAIHGCNYSKINAINKITVKCAN